MHRMLVLLKRISCFLRLIQTEIPAIKIEIGNNTTDIYDTIRLWASVNVRRRSVGSFGRIEIKLSSCASHDTLFRKRLPLPWVPENPFDAKSESPYTISRDFLFS